MSTAQKNNQISVSNSAVLANITLLINTGKVIINEINKTNKNLDVLKCLNTRIIKKVKGKSYDWYKEVRELLQEIYPDNYFFNQFENICTTQWVLDLDTFKKLRASKIKTIRENNCYTTAWSKINSTNFYLEWEAHKRGMLKGMQSAIGSGLEFLEDRKNYINIYGINNELIALEPGFHKMVNKLSNVFPEYAIDEYSEAKLADSDDNWHDIFDKIIDEGKDCEGAITENKEELLIKPKRKIMKICPSNLGNDDYERVCNNIGKYKFWFEKEFAKRMSIPLLNFLPEWNDPIPKYDHNDSNKSSGKLNSYRVDLIFGIDDLKNRIVQKIQEAESVKATINYPKAEKPDFQNGVYIPQDPKLENLNSFITRFVGCLDASIWIEIREEERNKLKEKMLKSGDPTSEHIIEETIDQYFLKMEKPRFRRNDEFPLTKKRYNEIRTYIKQNIIDLYNYFNAEMPEYIGFFEQIQSLAPQLLDKPSTVIHHLYPTEGVCDKKAKENLELCVDHYISGIETILRQCAKKINGVESSLTVKQHPLSFEQIHSVQHINTTENRTTINIVNLSSSPETRGQLAIENKDEPEKNEPKAKKYLPGKAKSWNEVKIVIKPDLISIKVYVKKTIVAEDNYTILGLPGAPRGSDKVYSKLWELFLRVAYNPLNTNIAPKSSVKRKVSKEKDLNRVITDYSQSRDTKLISYISRIRTALKKYFGLDGDPISTTDENTVSAYRFNFQVEFDKGYRDQLS